jgi:arylformamidase
LSERERQYSPSSRIDDIAPYIAAYGARSRAAEAQARVLKDLRWGKGPDETLDFFPAARADAPLLVFIHGGYWQELSKEESLFAGADCVADGMAFAAINYSLAPAVRLGQIVDQCRRALAWLQAEAGRLGFDGRRIHVAGSSAGGHLAAMMLTPRPVPLAGLVLLSGVFDLEPIAGTYIDEPLRLTAQDIATLSPQRLDPGAALPVLIAWGENETDEFKRQSRDYAAHLRQSGFAVTEDEIPVVNHFDIVFDLGNAASRLGRAVMDQVA